MSDTTSAVSVSPDPSVSTEILGLFNTAQSDITTGTPRSQTRYYLDTTGSPRRADLESFIASRFNKYYGASIVEFYPLLLARYDRSRISSIVGLRSGSNRPLFLEQYLETSLAQTIAHKAGQTVQRDSIMEIGNLASSFNSGNRLMFVLLTAILARAGYMWVVFTATNQVRSMLERLNLKPVSLCQADESKLVDENQVWGSYYRSQPIVQAGNVAEAMAILQSAKVARRFIDDHEHQIATLASQLQCHHGREHPPYV